MDAIEKAVALRSYCEAIDQGLDEWMRQESAKPGRKYPTVVLDSASLKVLGAAVAIIRERARELSIVRVRVKNDEVDPVITVTPGKLRSRLRERISDRCPMPRYVEVETADGPLWVSPRYDDEKGMFRISASVCVWNDRYLWITPVVPIMAGDEIEIPFEPPYPPGFVQRLASHGHGLVRIAEAVPAVATRLREVFQEFGIQLKALFERLLRKRDIGHVVEVVRKGKIEIVEVGLLAVVGGGPRPVFEERGGDARIDVIDTQPNMDGIRAFMDDLRTEGAAIRDVVAGMLDIVDGTRTTAEEMTAQQVFLEQMRVVSIQASTAAATYLARRGVIRDATAWRQERVEEVVAALGDREGIRYKAQVRRRLGKEDAAPSLLYKRLALIAKRDLPSDVTAPEHAIIEAARAACALLPSMPVFVPPLDQMMDVSLTMIVVSDIAVSDERARTAAKDAEHDR